MHISLSRFCNRQLWNVHLSLNQTATLLRYYIIISDVSIQVCEFKLWTSRKTFANKAPVSIPCVQEEKKKKKEKKVTSWGNWHILRAAIFTLQMMIVCKMKEAVWSHYAIAELSSTCSTRTGRVSKCASFTVVTKLYGHEHLKLQTNRSCQVTSLNSKKHFNWTLYNNSYIIILFHSKQLQLSHWNHTINIRKVLPYNVPWPSEFTRFHQWNYFLTHLPEFTFLSCWLFFLCFFL